MHEKPLSIQCQQTYHKSGSQNRALDFLTCAWQYIKCSTVIQRQFMSKNKMCLWKSYAPLITFDFKILSLTFSWSLTLTSDLDLDYALTNILLFTFWTFMPSLKSVDWSLTSWPLTFKHDLDLEMSPLKMFSSMSFIYTRGVPEVCRLFS